MNFQFLPGPINPATEILKFIPTQCVQISPAAA